MIGKKVAVLCDSVPDQILQAAGLVSEKIENVSNEHELSNKYIVSNLCSYSQNALDYFWESKEQYSGIIFTNSCHAMETLYEICKCVFRDKFVYLLDVPRDRSLNSVNYFNDSLINFIKSLEAYFGVEITNEKLEKACNIVRKMNILRMKVENITNSGQNTIDCKTMKKIQQKYNDMNLVNFEKLCEDSIKHCITEKKCIRVMICGSNMTPLKLPEFIADNGGNVVVFDMNNGIRRYSHEKVNNGRNIIENITLDYLYRPLGTMTANLREREKEVMSSIKNLNIDVVIIPVIKFCSDQIFFSALLSKSLAAQKIPYLVLNTEYCDECAGQIMTRIEAMLEMIS